jgi:hypothetical protein
MNRTPLDPLLDKFFDLFFDKNKSQNIAQIFYSMLGRLWIFLILSIIPGVLTNFWNWMYIPMLVLLVYPLQLAFILITYAWIINPINIFKYNRKVKRTYRTLENKILAGNTTVIVNYPQDNTDTYLIYNLIYERESQYGKDMTSLVSKTKGWGTIPYIYNIEFENLIITANVPINKAFDTITTTITYTFDKFRLTNKKK